VNTFTTLSQFRRKSGRIQKGDELGSFWWICYFPDVWEFNAVMKGQVPSNATEGETHHQLKRLLNTASKPPVGYWLAII